MRRHGSREAVVRARILGALVALLVEVFEIGGLTAFRADP